MHSVNIIPERGYKPGHIRRTAGTGKPALAHGFYMIVVFVLPQHFRIHLKRIYIEKLGAIQRHSADYGIVERPLHDIRISAVVLQL
ncbi:hypothetical protein D3C75_815210 [compost metagenome]